MEAEREAGALLHELLDGYRSPARHDQEVRELQDEVRELRQDMNVAETAKAIAEKRIVYALALLALAQKECGANAKLEEAIKTIEEIDLG